MNLFLNLERTLAIIKPHAFEHYSSILRRIHLAGFHILQEQCCKLSTEQAEKFLKCHEQISKNNESVISMEIKELSSAPLIALCLGREDAIERWLDLMGPEDCSIAQIKTPTSLRALYGDDNGNVIKNAVYGSKCASDAEKELHFFFPNMTSEDIYNNVDDIQHYLTKYVMQPLTNAFYEMTKIKPQEPLEWIARFLLDDNGIMPLIEQPCTETLNLIDKVKRNEENHAGCKDELHTMKMDCGCEVIMENAQSVSCLNN